MSITFKTDNICEFIFFKKDGVHWISGLISKCCDFSISINEFEKYDMIEIFSDSDKPSLFNIFVGDTLVCSLAVTRYNIARDSLAKYRFK